MHEAFRRALPLVADGQHCLRLLAIGGLLSLSCRLSLAAGDVAATAAGESYESRSPLLRRLQSGSGLEQADACVNRSRWDGISWANLTRAEQNAWLMLEWTQETWDAAHPVAQNDTTDSQAPAAAARPAVATSCYGNMTQDRRDAVLSLGYTIQSWHACEDPSCPWPEGIPLPNASCLDLLVFLEAKYNSTPWLELSPGTRGALSILGWNEYGTGWSQRNMPNVYALGWAQLHPSEVEAARFLGYTPAIWDGCQTETPCILRLEILEAKMKAWMWDQMPTGIQARLEELGWTQRSWAEGEEPEVFKTNWMDLPYSQQIVAKLLGFSEDTWAGCPTALCLDRFGYISRRFAGVAWSSLTLAEQRAWLLLEHTPELWAQARVPKTMELRWEELTPEQQSQATLLGHSAGTWQGCSQNRPARIDLNISAEEASSPVRTVRVQMAIQRPYSEISGNVYGAQVATLPTSFIQLFERSIARALFCGNPPVSTQSGTYVGSDGLPLCILKEQYEAQRGRIEVISVVEGSIIVDFYIRANRTAQEVTSPLLFESLERLVTQPNSPLTQDMEFGNYARASTVREVPLAYLEYEERAAALKFENLRSAYSTENACQLSSDARAPARRCPSSAARGLVEGATHALLLGLASAIVASLDHSSASSP